MKYLILLVVLSGCGMQVTDEHFRSDIPGLTAHVAPAIIADGMDNCPRAGGMDASYRRSQTDESVAFACTP
jgi:hypothetical protein